IDAQCYLYAFDAKTGAPLWSGPQFSGPMAGVQLPGTTQAKPAVIGDQIWLCMDYTFGLIVYGTDGTLKGQSAVGSNSGDGSAAIAGGWVYKVSDDGKLWGVNITDFADRWHFDGPKFYEADCSASSPAIANGVAYYGYYTGASQTAGWYVEAVDTRTHNALWAKPCSLTAYDQYGNPRALRISGPPAVANGVVYCGSYDQDWSACLCALDAATGVQIGWWEVSN